MDEGLRFESGIGASGNGTSHVIEKAKAHRGGAEKTKCLPQIIADKRGSGNPVK
jgi:hypothetical protein